MTIRAVTDAASARTIIGYRATSDGTYNAGSAVAGDIVTLPTGTIDLGASDNILAPAPGVTVRGNGIASSIVIGRIYAEGSGGVADPITLEGWRLRSDGLASISALSLGGGEASVNGMQDVSAVLDRFKVDDASPIGASGNNLFTLWSENGDAIVVALIDTQMSGADADVLSTKGDALRSSMCIRIGGSYDEWGSGLSDNGYTGHDDWIMYGWGGTFTRATASGIALSHASNANSASYDANITVSGGHVAAFGLYNSVVDMGDAGTPQTQTFGDCQWCHFKNNNNDIFIDIDSSIADCAFTDFGSTHAAFDMSAVSGTVNIDRIVVDGYRGVDMRGSSGTINLADSILKTSSQPALKDDPGGTMNTSGNSVQIAGFNVPFTGTGDTIASIAQATVDDRVAEIDAMFGTALEPSGANVSKVIKAGDGGDLLLLSAVELARQYSGGSLISRLHYGLGLKLGLGL